MQTHRTIFMLHVTDEQAVYSLCHLIVLSIYWALSSQCWYSILASLSETKSNLGGSISIFTCTQENRVPAVVQLHKAHVDAVAPQESARLPSPDSSVVSGLMRACRWWTTCSAHPLLLEWSFCILKNKILWMGTKHKTPRDDPRRARWNARSPPAPPLTRWLPRSPLYRLLWCDVRAQQLCPDNYKGIQCKSTLSVGEVARLHPLSGYCKLPCRWEVQLRKLYTPIKWEMEFNVNVHVNTL